MSAPCPFFGGIMTSNDAPLPEVIVFEPAEVTISVGESVHFVNNMLPPHNVIVEDHPDLGHEALAMMPGEEFDVAFPEAGDYTYWCGPHKGAGMIGTVHVE